MSDERGRILADRRIDVGLEGYSELLAVLAEHTDEPATVPVAIETDKNLLVTALQHAGFDVYAINLARWPATANGIVRPGRNQIR